MSETPTKSKWVTPVLFLSLALNLLVIGIVAGWYFTAGSERPDRVGRDVSQLVGPQFFRALEADDRRALIRDVSRQRDRIRENRSELRKRIEMLFAVLEAETFDTEAARALLEEQRASVASRHQFGEELLLTRLNEMSAQERKDFAMRLKESLRPSRKN